MTVQLGTTGLTGAISVLLLLQPVAALSAHAPSGLQQVNSTLRSAEGHSALELSTMGEIFSH